MAQDRLDVVEAEMGAHARGARKARVDLEAKRQALVKPELQIGETPA